MLPIRFMLLLLRLFHKILYRLQTPRSAMVSTINSSNSVFKNIIDKHSRIYKVQHLLCVSFTAGVPIVIY